MAIDKGEEVVPPLKKGKEVVSPLVDELVQDHPNAKRRNYGHYHEKARQTHFNDDGVGVVIKCKKHDDTFEF
ncbi:hypothetical protein D1007_55704 [Hordeum vulgare]|nr:hypothetical protein D1007_55704 [Hordeum vulgare]